MARPFTPLRDRFERFISPEPNSGCWLWSGLPANFGYGKIWIGEGRSQYAHRVSWELHQGPVPAGLCVLHKCDVPACVNPDHLFLGTDLDNSQDRDRKGRRRGGVSLGEQSGAAKLTADQVIGIRASAAPTAAIATEFKVSRSLVNQIRRRAIWRHI